MFRVAFALAFAAWVALPAGAFPIFLSTPKVAVVEYYNAYLDHYFLTATLDEMAALDRGAAGPGWSRTGWSFEAYTVDARFGAVVYLCPSSGCGKPVARFSGTPGLGPNSHFYTAEPTEIAALEQPGSGWTFEREAFRLELPSRPDGTGQCAAGLTPVYRLYNNRWMYNDSNHRYVTDDGERAKMQARGWVDEGVHFCAYGANLGPLKSYLVAPSLAGKILSTAQCQDESVNRDACVGVSNLPAPFGKYTFPSSPPDTSAFFNLTGTRSNYVFVADMWSPTASEFVQFDGAMNSSATLLGIHVDSSKRTTGDLSGIGPLYQFHTTIQPGAVDDRFFAWAGYESPTELRVSYTLNVKTLHTSGPDSAAYGNAVLEFIDTKSGRSIVFKAVTYQSSELAQGDSAGVDATTGKVTVRSTLRAGSPYLRVFGAGTLFTPSGFVPPDPWGYGGDFAFRMNRDEFQRILDGARALDAALSPSPDDYIVANARLDNEVYKDGDIGLNLADFKLEVWKR